MSRHGLSAAAALLVLAGAILWLDYRLGAILAFAISVFLWTTSAMIHTTFRESTWTYFLDAYGLAAGFCSMSVFLIIPVMYFAFMRNRLGNLQAGDGQQSGE